MDEIWKHAKWKYEMSRIGKSMKTENRLVVTKGKGRKELRVTTKGYGVTLRGMKNILEFDINNDCKTL